MKIELIKQKDFAYMENKTREYYYEHGRKLLFSVQVKKDEDILINGKQHYSLSWLLKQLLKYSAFYVDTNSRNLLISIFNQKLGLTKSHLLSIYETHELHDQGLFYIRLSAEQGYAPAQYELSEYLRNRFYGSPVMSNVYLDATEFVKTEAFLWCEKAAEQGYVQAQFRVAEELIDVFYSFCKNKLDLNLNLDNPFKPKQIYPNSDLEKQSMEAVNWVNKASYFLDLCIKNTQNEEEIYKLSIVKLNFLIQKKHLLAKYVYDYTGSFISEDLDESMKRL